MLPFSINIKELVSTLKKEPWLPFTTPLSPLLFPLYESLYKAEKKGAWWLELVPTIPTYRAFREKFRRGWKDVVDVLADVATAIPVGRLATIGRVGRYLPRIMKYSIAGIIGAQTVASLTDSEGDNVNPYWEKMIKRYSALESWIKKNPKKAEEVMLESLKAEAEAEKKMMEEERKEKVKEFLKSNALFLVVIALVVVLVVLVIRR